MNYSLIEDIAGVKVARAMGSPELRYKLREKASAAADYIPLGVTRINQAMQGKVILGIDPVYSADTQGGRDPVCDYIFYLMDAEGKITAVRLEARAEIPEDGEPDEGPALYNPGVLFAEEIEILEREGKK